MLQNRVNNDIYIVLYITQNVFNLLLFFQRYAPDKLLIANIKKGSNSLITYGRVMVFAFCTLSDGLLSIY